MPVRRKKTKSDTLIRKAAKDVAQQDKSPMCVRVVYKSAFARETEPIGCMSIWMSRYIDIPLSLSLICIPISRFIFKI